MLRVIAEGAARPADRDRLSVSLELGSLATRKDLAAGLHNHQIPPSAPSRSLLPGAHADNNIVYFKELNT